MQWFIAEDVDEPELVGILHFVPLELRVYDDAFAISMTPDGVVIDAFELPQA